MQGFDAANPPFDRLTQGEAEEVRAALDVVYLRPGEVVVRSGSPADALYVIIKGMIEAREGDHLQTVLGPKDSFDARAVVHGRAGEDFIAGEETLLYAVPRPLVLDLVQRNAGFAAFFYSDISRKLDAIADQRRDGVESVLHTHIRDARLSPAVFIDGDTTIEAAGRRMQEVDTNALFVRDGDRVGMITGMNLSKAVILRRLPLETPVRDISHFDVVAVEADDFIFEALLTMTRHDKRRIAVRREGAYVGILEDIDILGLFAGNSQLIPGRIDRARDESDLKAAAGDIAAQVERLHRQGVRVESIAEITSDLNRRLFERLFEFTAPTSIQEAGCLLLMGSEGRGEQTVRTDQDNALLLAVPVPEQDLLAFREAFSGALDRFGFPPCPGNVMVRNPIWSQPVEDFERQIRQWVAARTPEAAINIAIFSDAVAVAGRSDLLGRAKTVLFEALRGEAALLARFAHLVETFATPQIGVLSALMSSVGVGADEIDIKRSGTFPIVHGVRALAIDKGVTAVSTAGRVSALVELGTLAPEFGRELVAALHVFMEYRLRTQLDALHRGEVDAPSTVRVDSLSTLDRDMLRDALRIVRQFRDLLRNRYHFGAF